MNRIKSTLTTLMRSLPTTRRGWVGRAPPRNGARCSLAGPGGPRRRGAAATSTTASTAATPSHSTTIALTSDETAPRRRQSRGEQRFNHSSERRSRAMTSPSSWPKSALVKSLAAWLSTLTTQVAYVTNGISGTVSVVDLVLAQGRGDDPRGHRAAGLRADAERHRCSMWRTIRRAPCPSSSLAIRSTRSPSGPCNVGRNPTALAITNNGDANDADETVFVTQIFAELNPDFVDPMFDGNGEARDLGKQGVVQAFPAGNANPPITKITLAPIADSGFNANRVAPFNFCNTVAARPISHLLPGPERSERTP